MLRIAVQPTTYRVETLVLPLIDNTIYTRLAEVLGGAPAALDEAPRSQRTLMTLAAKVDKRPLLAPGDGLRDLEDLAGPDISRADLKQFLERGVGDRITLQVCDQQPMFDFSVPEWISTLFGWSSSNVGFDGVAWTFLLTSLNAPVCATVDVQDAAVVDGFLERLDASLAARARSEEIRGAWIDFDLDFYRLGGDAGPVRCVRIGLGPLGWRLFWTRIGRHLVVASRKDVLDDLMRAPAPAAAGPTGHAQLVIRPEAWNAVRPDYELGWAENARQACLRNVGPVANLLRAVPPDARAEPAALRARLDALAHEVYGARFYCPDGGQYVPDGERACRCTVHGTLRAPVQGAALAPDSEVGRLLRSFRGARMTLTFLPEGLRAVVEIDQK